MKTIRPRSPYDVQKSCPYEGPYRRPHERIADIIFTVVIAIGLSFMAFIYLSK